MARRIAGEVSSTLVIGCAALLLELLIGAHAVEILLGTGTGLHLGEVHT